jgi:hypothetical protein
VTGSGPGASVAVIVQTVPGSMPEVERATVGLGGRISRELAIIDGFAATLV